MGLEGEIAEFLDGRTYDALKTKFNLDKFPDSWLNIEAAINFLKAENIQYKSSFLELRAIF